MATSSLPTKRSKVLHVVLWIVHVVLGLLFVATGLFKLVKPVQEIALLWPWAGENPDLLHLTGVFDLLGGVGLILPGAARLWTGLTVWAALGCALLMISAIIFHFARGEGANTPFNFGLLALSLLIAWGRRKIPLTDAPAAKK